MESEARNGRRLPSRGMFPPRSWRRIAVALMAALLLVSVWTAWPSYGAVPKLDTIRVAIFIDLPKYKLNTTTGTFSASTGLEVGVRQPSGVRPLLTTKAGETVRITLDDYKVRVFESADFAKALAAAKRVKAAGGSPFLTSASKGGLVYQVQEGSYPTAAAAKTAAAKWTGDGTLASITGKAAATVTGPMHLEAGVYASREEANSAAAAFSAANLDAYVAMKQSGSAAAVYTVLVGSAADSAGLAAVKTASATIPEGAALTAADTASSYLLMLEDYAVTGASNAPQALYAVPASGTKVWLSTASENGIKFAERYGRSYRGQFEVSGLNGKLTIVNELPFEQYLYSVVGAEMPASWHAEALKAQAVAARTYALYQGFGFQVAHVVDTVLSQAYGGISAEKPATIKAVDATKGEVAMYGGKLIETVFSSSAGGDTAEAQEIWGGAVPYLKTVKSPDEVSEKGLYKWYRVVLPSGVNGYIREDLLAATDEKTAAGSPIMSVKGNGVKVRPIPLVQDAVAPVSQVNSGTRVVVLEKVTQSNEMSWVRGPFTSSELLATIKSKVKTAVQGPILTLEISKTGPSGRPTEIKANGSALTVGNPDAFRSAFGGLPSTNFRIDETSRMTIAGAAGTAERTSGSAGFIVQGGEGKAEEIGVSQIYILNGKGEIRAATKEPSFRFVGNGYGHGVGLSQYGARGLAEAGYDYQYILQYYYKDVTIGKE
ncbi:SpoIID/LytB domain-containing protein [Paenibacillus methanolicus]|uniref:Stage II sporulation protein D n=1 Tax=Paenibacillus methanolicus TaxID=582686 RepID=A0A5S5C5T8_9BACL|nr:SpoIID/LytB domain-containing protein [Paenibacillus methanolicus]TYP73832.1 stage II sporulation protein D [Paenibacillus methanolicus]